MTVRSSLLRIAAVLAVAVGAIAVGAGAASVAAQTAADPEAGRLFEPLRLVMQHPRCQNCHAPGDGPLQSDTGAPHVPNVRRGPDGKGIAATRCATCHLGVNARSPAFRREVPGAPDWHMPPATAPMTFKDVAPRALCEALRDPTANGGRDREALGRHMLEDALLAWAWNPGGDRSVPALSKPDFDAAAIAWLRAGAPCP